MAHQLSSRIHAGLLAGSQNPSPAKPARLWSTTSAPEDCHSHGRPSLKELDVGLLGNIQHLVPQTFPLDKQPKALAGVARYVNAPDSPAEDLSNYHCSRQGGHDFVEATTPALERRFAHASNSVQSNSVHLTSRVPTAGFLQKTPWLAESLEAKRTENSQTGTSSSPVEVLSAHLAGVHELSSEVLLEPGVQRAIQRHNEKKFNWILSLPQTTCASTRDKHLRRSCSTADLPDNACQDHKVYLGCNLLLRRPPSSHSATSQSCAYSYVLLATPLDHSILDTKRPATGSMLDALTTSGVAMPFGPDIMATEQMLDSPKMFGVSPNAVSLAPPQLASRSSCSSVSRIEDSLEELDKLEDQFEAVNRMVLVDRVPSPDKEACIKGTAKTGSDTAKEPGAKATLTRTSRQATHTVSRTASVRKSAVSANGSKTSAGTAQAAASVTAKRMSISRPLSLLPPKPPSKSSKPPTKSTFELPGEAVARRLKEQRDARLAAAAAAATVPTNPSPAPNAKQQRKAHPSKPPTIPTFELPGEAISRRKREEHEVKIRQQEEEEKKRREFKARPIRLHVTPSTVPRETVTSRARQNRVSIIGESAIVGGRLDVLGPTPAGTKRMTMTSAESSAYTTGQGFVSRGRGAVLGSPPPATGQTSRAASTSTGSISGKRSTVSAEDVQHQKLRGIKVLQRDNVLSCDRDRERREREEVAKKARQEAAERSRALSRQWAEKQRLKAEKAAPASSGN